MRHTRQQLDLLAARVVLMALVLWTCFLAWKWIAAGKDTKATPMFVWLIVPMMAVSLVVMGLTWVDSRPVGKRLVWTLLWIPVAVVLNLLFQD
jgi:hypothetical protein